MKALRFRKKKRAAREGGGGWRNLLRSRLLVLCTVVVVIGGGIGLSRWVYRVSAGLFPAREMVFHGNMHLSEGELKALAAISRNESLLALSAKELSEKLLQSPWIRDVSIRKEFPHRVLIKIIETSPFAILEMKGRAFLVDERGRMLEEMKGAVPFLPIINADPFKNRDNFMEALNLAKVVRDRKIAAERNRVEIIADKGAENIALVLDSVVIKMGHGDYEQKLDRLFALEEEIKKRAITIDYVDLRFANRVVVKPISEVVR